MCVYVRVYVYTITHIWWQIDTSRSSVRASMSRWPARRMVPPGVSYTPRDLIPTYLCVAVCCSMMQCVAVCCCMHLCVMDLVNTVQFDTYDPLIYNRTWSHMHNWNSHVTFMHVSACVRKYIWTKGCIWVYKQTYTWKYIYVYIHVHINICTHTYIYIHTYIYVSIHICIYICICI